MIYKRIEKPTGMNSVVERKRPAETLSCYHSVVLSSPPAEITPLQSTKNESSYGSEIHMKEKETKNCSEKMAEKNLKVTISCTFPAWLLLQEKLQI
jgi:hypothetical protein